MIQRSSCAIAKASATAKAFFGDCAIGHRVEICAIHGCTHAATVRSVSLVPARATAGSSQAKPPIPRPGADPVLVFSIADLLTGTYGQAQLASHVFSDK
jgi:hypothetical protein